jgi:hypothetical protein
VKQTWNVLALTILVGLSGDVEARWLSVDPVQAQANRPVTFNRYHYAANNPYKFTDPDGREIKYSLVNGATRQDQTDTMGYLLTSSSAAADILNLHFSKETYNIQFDRSNPTGYDHDTRIITINPTEGLVVASSGDIQSPALGGYHEISHAVQHDKIGTDAMIQSLTAPLLKSEGFKFTFGTSPEEKRATQAESKVAGELGEAKRNNYTDDKGTVKTCGATSTTEC